MWSKSCHKFEITDNNYKKVFYYCADGDAVGRTASNVKLISPVKFEVKHWNSTHV